MSALLELSGTSSIRIPAGHARDVEITLRNLGDTALKITNSLIDHTFQADKQYRIRLSQAVMHLEAQHSTTCLISIRCGANAATVFQEMLFCASFEVNNQIVDIEHAFQLQIHKNFITDLLPAIMRRDAGPDQMLSPMLSIMHDYHQHIEQGREVLPAHFNPYTCPEHFIPLLIKMLDLDRIFSDTQAISADPKKHRSSCPIGRLRNIIAIAIHCSHWRGTSRGLRLFLHTATGLKGFTISENPVNQFGKNRAFHIIVTVPAIAMPHLNLIQKIISNEKPAYVTAELAFFDNPQLARAVPTLGQST